MCNHNCIFLVIFVGDGRQVNVWRNESAAWPVANPVLTCASLTNSGFPSNFIADPFLYVQVYALSLTVF